MPEQFVAFREQRRDRPHVRMLLRQLPWDLFGAELSQPRLTAADFLVQLVEAVPLVGADERSDPGTW